MKRRRVIFILSIISLIVLSLNICSFAMNTGFSTSEPDEKKQQEGKGWEKRSGKKPRKQPRPHSPSKKDHRKKFNK